MQHHHHHAATHAWREANTEEAQALKKAFDNARTRGYGWLPKTFAVESATTTTRSDNKNHISAGSQGHNAKINLHIHQQKPSS